MRLFSSATPTLLLCRLLKWLGLVRILTPHKYVLNEAFHPVLDSLAGQMLTCLDDTNPQLTVSALSGQSMRKESTKPCPNPYFSMATTAPPARHWMISNSPPNSSPRSPARNDFRLRDCARLTTNAQPHQMGVAEGLAIESLAQTG